MMRYGVVRLSHYRVSDCNFYNNHALADARSISSLFGKGGGLCVIIHGKSTSNVVQIMDCTFTGNFAKHGGGLYLVMLDRSHGNNITVQYTKIPVFIKMGEESALDTRHIKEIIFQMCRFYDECEWNKNVASFGSAVYIAPDFRHLHITNLMVKISFNDCIFISNYLKTIKTVSFEHGKGTLLAVGYSIVFDGVVVFDSNEDSGMDLTSTELVFGSHSNVQFANNRAIAGGAISLLGFSTLTLNDDSVFSFINNSAVEVGGAIFQKIYSKRDYSTSRSCFINYNGGKSLIERNISLVFQNNTAGGCGRNCTKLGKYGHSLYATTIIPCYNSGDCRHAPISEAFNCIGDFVFIDQVLYEISTAGNETKLTQNDGVIRVIPGKVTQLPIETLNDYSMKISTDYYIAISNSNVTVDSAFNYHIK